jgi:hypothetical protein
VLQVCASAADASETAVSESRSATALLIGLPIRCR